jgi:hypothetical protein
VKTINTFTRSALHVFRNAIHTFYTYPASITAALAFTL